MERPTLLANGATFAGDYQVERPLSQGGMGAVFVVQQRSTGKRRALKLMHAQLVANPELRRRFEQEARVGSRIASEHVVEVQAAGVDGTTGLPFIVMELLEGEDLMTRVQRSGPLPAAEVRAVFEQLCHAMSAAHGAGIVHRDLKPENVFLARALRAGGPPFTVKVLDFGIAKLAAEAGTHGTTGAMGSPLWMAPEQTERGTVTPAADVWAMGLLAYTLLTGRLFWRTPNEVGGTVAQLLREIVLEPVPPASARAAEQGVAALLPPGFDAWFARCVTRDPSARFGHAAELFHALEATLDGAPMDFAATTLGPPPASGAPSSGPPHAPPVRVQGSIASAPPQAAARAPSQASAAPMAGAIDAGTPSAMSGMAQTAGTAATGSRAWMVVALVASGLLLLVGGSAATWFAMRAPIRAQAAAEAATAPLAPPPRANLAPPPPIEGPQPPASVAVQAPTPPTVAAQKANAPPQPKPAPKIPLANPKGPTAQAADADPTGPSGSMNSHTWKLKNEAHVRMVGRLVKNDSNVADDVVRKAVEWSAWQYNRCYDNHFGTLKPEAMPSGTVIVGFDILDQLPRHGTVDKSDFSDPTFGECVKGTLVGQTINAAGPNGKGHVTYAFKFVPN
jgi:serine/threonine-protein kinase